MPVVCLCWPGEGVDGRGLCRAEGDGRGQLEYGAAVESMKRRRAGGGKNILTRKPGKREGREKAWKRQSRAGWRDGVHPLLFLREIKNIDIYIYRL